MVSGQNPFSDGRLLAGKVAIVTGGGKGIGQAIATAFAEAGAMVAIAARGREDLDQVAAAISKRGGQCLALATDVSSPDQVGAMVAATVEKFGTVDVLVNNSGIGGPAANLEQITPAEWEETLSINLSGPFLCCRAVLPIMKHKRYGRIINISSISGRRPLPQRAPYTASKLGLIGLTRTLAAEVGRYNITVNAISPGATEGPRLDWVVQNIARLQGRTIEEVRQGLASAAALGRLVTAQDIAGGAVYLASELGRSITGEDLNISAGLHMY